MSELLCPSCGSTNISTTNEPQEFSLKSGANVKYLEVINTCDNCGEVGDFLGANDEKIKRAVEKNEEASSKELASHLLGEISAKGIKMAFMERVLDLPQRTLSRWKSTSVSAPGIALLKFIQTFPWLLNVADHNYDIEFAKREMLKESLKLVSEGINFKPRVVEVVSRNDNGNFIWGALVSVTLVGGTNQAESNTVSIDNTKYSLQNTGT